MWQVRGHEPLLRQLERSLRQGRYAHAYLLAGQAQVGKRTLAINMAQAVNCSSPEDAPCGKCSQCTRIAAAQHPDVVVIGVQRDEAEGPPRKEIGIDTVREVQHQANLKPYEGSHRVYIFDGAEYMSDEAANALLKTLEEPPPQVMIILLTTREEALLPTIRSRCRRLELKPLPLDQVARELVNTHSIGQDEAEVLARLSMGSLGWALSAVSNPSIMEKRGQELERIAHLSGASLEERFNYASNLASVYSRNREDAREVLYLWLRWWRDLLLIKEGAEEFVHNVDYLDTLRLGASEYDTAQLLGCVQVILRTLEALENNANPRLALEVMMLRLPGGSPHPRVRNLPTG